MSTDHDSVDRIPTNTVAVVRAALIAAAAMTLVGATQTIASRRLEDLPVDVARVVMREASTWFAWAVLAPLIAKVFERVKGRTSGLRIRTILVVAAFAALFAHSAIEVTVARAAGLVPTPMPFGLNLTARFSGTLAPNLVILGLIVFALRGVEHYHDVRGRERREAELNAQLAHAQLTILRTQLQPHFLFNTLHAVSSLMEQDVVSARRMLVRLGDLLRLTLTHGATHYVTLEQELGFLEKYVDIQRIRFEDRLRVIVEAPPMLGNARVPSLLLQPLVENALRHGVERRAGPGLIRISTAVVGDTLYLEVADDGPGLSDPSRVTKARGVGLANTRDRLVRLYGDAHTFELEKATEGGLAVRIAIPFEMMGQATSNGRGGSIACAL